MLNKNFKFTSEKMSVKKERKKGGGAGEDEKRMPTEPHDLCLIGMCLWNLTFILITHRSEDNCTFFNAIF